MSAIATAELPPDPWKTPILFGKSPDFSESAPQSSPQNANRNWRSLPALPPARSPYENWSLKRLKAEAKRLNIRGWQAMKKPETLIARLEAAIAG